MIYLQYLKKIVALSIFLNILFITCSVFSSIKNEAVLTLIINGEKIGDSFCILEDDKIYVPIESLKEANLREIGGLRLNIEGKEYIELNSWKEIKFELNEERLELNITVPPEYLPAKTISLYPQRRQKAIIPEQDSAFLNYRFDYYNTEGVEDLYINHELGIRVDKFTFLTNGFYSDNTGRYIRLDTALYLDDRRTLNRLIIGDFTTPSSPTTSGNKMIGISYFRNFNIDPYFIYKPTFDIRTFANLPSEVEIYLDDMLIRRESVPPGEVNLLDLYYYGGRRDVRVLIKDPFGRVEVLSYPMYFTDVMLKKGIREFNYSLGFLRENYGIESNRYTEPGLFAMERYGYNESLNIGGRFATVPAKDFYNISAETNFLLGYYGVLGLLGAYSNLEKRSGFAIMSSYSYTRKNLSFRTTGLYTWDNYSSSPVKFTEEIKKSFSVGTSYYMTTIGSLSLDYIHNKYINDEKNLINLGYARSFKGKINLFANLTRRLEKDNETLFFAGISIYPKRDHVLSARFEDTEGRTSEIIQLSKSAPLGEGYGYRINLERERTNRESEIINPYFQYRARYGVLEAEGFFRDSGERLYKSTRLAYSGAIAFVGNKLGMTRPIKDSFALIRTADVSDVKVDLNGQAIGRTDKKGYIFLPEVNSYYDNIITINDRDIPLEYDILTKEVAVSPWYRSGFCLRFPVERVYRYSGYLIAYYEDTGEKRPLEFYDLIIEDLSQEKEENGCITSIQKKSKGERKVTTGKDGEFYIEDLKPGIYKGKVKVRDITKDIELVLPDSKDLIIDLGVIEVPLQFEEEKSKGLYEAKRERLVTEEKDSSQVAISEIPPQQEKDKEVKSPLEFHEKEPLIYRVYFKFDSTELSSKKDLKTLNEVVSYLKSHDFSYIKIIAGHCDQLGSRKYNYRLGLRRAESVKKYLVDRSIPAEKIKELISYGKDLPVCTSIKESCRRQNRRVEIHIIDK